MVGGGENRKRWGWSWGAGERRCEKRRKDGRGQERRRNRWREKETTRWGLYCVWCIYSCYQMKSRVPFRNSALIGRLFPALDCFFVVRACDRDHISPRLSLFFFIVVVCICICRLNLLVWPCASLCVDSWMWLFLFCPRFVPRGRDREKKK